METLDHKAKLNKINTLKISDKSVVDLVEKAKEYYLNQEILYETGEKRIDQIFAICESRFPESVGIIKKKKEKPVDEIEETISVENSLDFLKSNQANRIKR